MTHDSNNHKVSSAVSEYEYSVRPSAWSLLWNTMGSSSSSVKKSDTLVKEGIREEESKSNLEPAEHKPDSRLENWRRWLDIHKEQQDKLSNILKRPPQCLLMNTNYNNLHVNQQKRLITEASGYEFSDKYRGHPYFWITDGAAHKVSEKLGIYHPIQKRYDRSHPSAQVDSGPKPTELEFVGVPDVIVKEKGLSGKQCLTHPKDNWESSQYVSKKKEKLKQKLCLFQEHMPQSEELMVVGTKCTQPEESLEVPELENSSVLSRDDSVSKNLSHLEESEPTIAESIAVLIDDKPVDNSLHGWKIYFEDLQTDEIYEKSFTIKNLSDSCLRYCWQAVLPAFVKSKLPLKQIKKSKTFYFNKNDSVAMPKSSVKHTFYFVSVHSGVFYEKWNLHLSSAPDKEECMTVELHAVVEERPEIEQSLKVIDSYIESCARYAIASKTVKEMFERSRPERPRVLPYDWMFFEEQIFLFNNPDLFYESKHVSYLKDIYKKITKGPWDFSVQTLRKMLFEKSLHEDMTGTVNEFTAAVCYLMKPKLNYSFTNEKHKTVRQLLCCFIDRMEKESDNLKHILKVPLGITKSLTFSDDTFYSILRTSALNPKESNLRKKSTLKKSRRKTTFSMISDTFGFGETSSSVQNVHAGDSREVLVDNIEDKIKKQEYLDLLYIKTYQHLSRTIDNIGEVIDSFDAQNKKRALLSIKTNLQHKSSS